MSKGKKRRATVALAMRMRNPEAWLKRPVAVVKVSRNQELLVLPTTKRLVR